MPVIAGMKSDLLNEYQSAPNGFNDSYLVKVGRREVYYVFIKRLKM